MDSAVHDAVRTVAAEVDELMSGVFTSAGGQPRRGASLDQAGLRDGLAIVDDYLAHNELECALHHLRYMVQEPPLRISENGFATLREVAISCGLGDGYFADIDPEVLFGVLPSGWDLERVEAKGVRAASLLPLSTYVVEDPRPLSHEYIELRPKALVDCGGLVLVWDTDDDHWHMGQVGEDGSVVCWASYGPDLGRAIEAL